MNSNSQQAEITPLEAGNVTEEDILRRVNLLNKRAANLDKREATLKAREDQAASKEDHLARDDVILEQRKATNNEHARICHERRRELAKVKKEQDAREQRLQVMEKKRPHQRAVLEGFFAPENKAKLSSELGRDPTFEEIGEAFEKAVEEAMMKDKVEMAPGCTSDTGKSLSNSTIANDSNTTATLVRVVDSRDPFANPQGEMRPQLLRRDALWID